MARTAVNINFQLRCQTCITCGIVFGVPSDWDDRRQRDHAMFYCPNGHGQNYVSETDLEKERRKSQMLADQVRMEREERLKAERKLARVQKGTCPKCNRHFVNVERHMKSKHA